jgi:hypothetical protein
MGEHMAPSVPSDSTIKGKLSILTNDKLNNQRRGR